MNKLRFLHIPKTAGSTFSTILKKQYRGKPNFVFSGDNDLDREKFAELSTQEQNSIALFTGHAPILTGIPAADDIDIITILREPISRVKSFCQHVSEGKSPHLLATFPPESFTLDEFLHSGNTELSNLQSRMLINYEHHRAEPLVKDWSSSSEVLEQALNNLFCRLKCYGIQEYFDESLMLFADTLKWRMPFYNYRNKRNSKRLLNFERHHIEKIHELNAIDIDFYRAAKTEFLARIKLDSFDPKKLGAFKRNNKFVSPVLHFYGKVGSAVVRLFR